MSSDISQYTSKIMNATKGETVRDSIIAVVRLLFDGDGKTASILNGAPITEFVVHSGNFDGREETTNWQETYQLTKDAIDILNFGYKQSDPEHGSAVLDNDISTAFKRLEDSRKAICDAINEAWRNTPTSGTHGSDEYLVIPNNDPFSDYPDLMKRIGYGEGLVSRVEELNVTENGIYTADDGKAYNKIVANVSEAQLGHLNITEDGTYNAASYGYDGFTFVHVAVPVVPTDDPSASSDPSQNYDYDDWANRVGGGTGASTEKCTVRFWGWEKKMVSTAGQYVGRYTWKRVELYKTRVDVGEDATYVGKTPTYTEMKKFSGWNPDPKNVQHNMDVYAVFEDIVASPDEIQDDWDTIVAKKGGTDYPIGSWKRLYVGDVYQNGSRIVVGNVKMVKVAGANASDGSTSTWICYESKFTTRMIWTETAFNACMSRAEYGNTDFAKWLDSYSFIANFPDALKDGMKKVTKNSRGFDFESQQAYVASRQCRVWVPSTKEIFYSTSASWPSTDTSYNYDGGPNYASYYFNGGASTTSFIYYNNKIPGKYTGPGAVGALSETNSAVSNANTTMITRDAMEQTKVDNLTDSLESYKEIHWVVMHSSNGSYYIPTVYTTPQEQSGNYYSYTRVARKYYNDPSNTSLHYREYANGVFFGFCL